MRREIPITRRQKILKEYENIIKKRRLPKETPKEALKQWKALGERIFGEYLEHEPQRFKPMKLRLTAKTIKLLEEIGGLPEDAKKKMEKIIRDGAMADLGPLDELHSLKIGDMHPSLGTPGQLREELLVLRRRGIAMSIENLMTQYERKFRRTELQALQRLFGGDKLDNATRIVNNCCLQYAQQMYSPEFMNFMREKYGTNPGLAWFDALTFGVRLWPEWKHKLRKMELSVITVKDKKVEATSKGYFGKHIIWENATPIKGKKIQYIKIGEKFFEFEKIRKKDKRGFYAAKIDNEIRYLNPKSGEFSE